MAYKLLLSILTVTIFVHSSLGICLQPECGTPQVNNLLWPHNNPYKFWQCAPLTGDVWAPVEKDCGLGGIVFSFQEQRCVWQHEWEDSCESGTPITPTEAPVPSSTSQSSTSDPTTTPEEVTRSTISSSSDTPTTYTPMPGHVDCCTLPYCTVNKDKWPGCPLNDGFQAKEYFLECVQKPTLDFEHVKRHCPINEDGIQMFFDYFTQKCVHPSLWSNPCFQEW